MCNLLKTVERWGYASFGPEKGRVDASLFEGEKLDK